MSIQSMKALLVRVEEEERAFTEKYGYPPRINEFSRELRTDIERDVRPEVVEMGLEDLKRFLRAF